MHYTCIYLINKNFAVPLMVNRLILLKELNYVYNISFQKIVLPRNYHEGF